MFQPALHRQDLRKALDVLAAGDTLLVCRPDLPRPFYAGSAEGARRLRQGILDLIPMRTQEFDGVVVIEAHEESPCTV